jgi:catechol 2,3-dioxygenase-like lactoylglutathione lyase family enzyme
MSLWNAKVVYLFVDTMKLERQQVFLGEVMGLEVIENTYHPPHQRHGVLKYDAGDTILALNIADNAFDPAGSDRVVTAFGASAMREAQVYARLQANGMAAPQVQGGEFDDPDRHRFVLRQRALTEPWMIEESPPRLEELRFSVDDLVESILFYERLGLTFVTRSASSATFASGNVDLVLQVRDPATDHAPPRWGFLTVFHTEDIHATCDALRDLGLTGLTAVRFSQIGGTARFKDPTGHRFCLYQPSAECFGWESGLLLQQIVNGPIRRTVPTTVQ